MPTSRLKDKLLGLPQFYKLVGIGALITLIGAFLPWYNDIDRFQKGVQFLGITGPLYLVGYIMVAISVFTLILMGFHIVGKKIPDLPIKESQVYIIGSAVAFFLLILTNSVFFHHEFGMNAIDKGYEYGMIISFLGVVAMMAGGIIQSKERGTSRMIKEFQEEALGIDEDEIEELNNFQKEVQENDAGKIADLDAATEVHEKPKTGVREYKAKPQPEPAQPARAQHPVQQQAAPVYAAPQKASQGRSEPFPDSSFIKQDSPAFGANNEKKSEANNKGINPNSVIRTDL